MIPLTTLPLFGELTHEGAANKPNEDAHGTYSIPYENEVWALLAVADGVTSESGSQQASQLAIDTVRQSIQIGVQALPTSFSPNDIRHLLEQAVLQADRRIKEAARHNTSGMSTTVVVALIAGNDLYAAHVGDSRAYLYRNRSLHLLTRDHTYAEEMIQQGKLEREEASKKANRNVLTRYLGPGPIPAIDLDIIPLGEGPENLPPADYIELYPGDTVLLCSDGLNSQVTDDEIGRILGKNQRDLQRGTDQLIRKALDKREPDNITAILFQTPHQGKGLLLPAQGLLWLAGGLLFALLAIFLFLTFSNSDPTQPVAVEETLIMQGETATETPAQPTPLPTSTTAPTNAPISTSIPLPTSTAEPAVTPIIRGADDSSANDNTGLEITPVQPSQTWQSDQSQRINTVTPIPILTPVAIATVPPPVIANNDVVTTTLDQRGDVGKLLSLAGELRKIEIDVDESNELYVVQFINPSSLPPQPEGLCIEVVLSNQLFAEEQKASEGLGKCNTEKSFAKNNLKPGNNYVTLWQYDLSSEKFLNLLSNQVRIDGGGSNNSNDKPSCEGLIDAATKECL